MHESDTSERGTRQRLQQAQPQPAQAVGKDQKQEAGHVEGFPVKESEKGEDQPGPADVSPDPSLVLDNARFTAGVVKLYEALLREPVPEEMLRLVKEIGEQERK